MKRMTLVAWIIVAVLAAGGIMNAIAAPPSPADDPDFASYDVAELLKRRADSKRAYLPFMNVQTMHMGMYVLPKEGEDGQSPHGQDEVYYCVSGKGEIELGTGEAQERRPVKQGSVVFVKAGVEHKFVSITEELELLVFFSKAPTE